jgi:hypothetical protein
MSKLMGYQPSNIIIDERLTKKQSKQIIKRYKDLKASEILITKINSHVCEIRYKIKDNYTTILVHIE